MSKEEKSVDIGGVLISDRYVSGVAESVIYCGKTNPDYFTLSISREDSNHEVNKILHLSYPITREKIDPKFISGKTIEIKSITKDGGCLTAIIETPDKEE